MAIFIAALLLLAGGAITWVPGYPAGTVLQAQGAPPPAPLMLITRDARRPVPTTMVSGQELIGLDDVATLFQVVVREDTLAGGVTVGGDNHTLSRR